MKPKTDKYDAIIVGGGHNGLVCAFYLARKGLSVKIVERRHIVGGAAVTEEFRPGFKNSVASYTVSLLNPKVIHDMDLHGHGLKIVERKVNNLWPHKNGNYLSFPTNFDTLKAEIARFSEKDAAALERYYDDLDKVADLFRSLMLDTPPNAGGGLRDIFKALKLAGKLKKLSIEDERLVLDIFTKSVAEFLDQYFENEYVKGAFAFDGVVGFYGSPHTPGTAYVLLHHAFGEVNGKKGLWGHAIGGMGAITQAMARACENLGVSIEANAPVKKILTENNKATGVELEDGRIVNAPIIAANVNPKLLYTELMDETDLSSDFQRRMQHYQCGSGTFRMNVALDKLPNFTCLQKSGAERENFLTGGVIIGETVHYLDKAFRDAQDHGYSTSPIVEMLIPSTLDSSLAPEGKHVASLFCQQFAPTLQDGQSWDDVREAAAQKIIDTVEDYAPGFKDSILSMQILSPLDLERTFGLVGGDIMHGRLSLDQMFSARPILGHANYRGPVKGLYMCGSGTHPGGGVTGAPGHNAAHEILKDI